MVSGVNIYLSQVEVFGSWEGFAHAGDHGLCSRYGVAAW